MVFSEYLAQDLLFAGSKPAQIPHSRCDWDARAESIRNILARCGYTVTQLSAATRRRHGSKSPYFIPVTFLYKVRSGVTPHVCQIAALSDNTGYRFADWLRMFGFDLRQVPRLQMRLHTERTVLITPTKNGSSLRAPPLLRRNPRSAILYARRRDGTAAAATCSPGSAPRTRWSSPELMPGSVVRVDRYTQRMKDAGRASMDARFWLVEQPGGLTCTQVRWIDDQQIVPLPCRPPWGNWPLRLPTEARVLGLVDTGLRPMTLPSSAGRTESALADAVVR